MKSYFKTLALVSISFYALVSFVSFTPNLTHWDVGGRGAFAFFTIIVSVVVEVAMDSFNNEQESKRK
jgi:hypothetical protein